MVIAFGAVCQRGVDRVQIVRCQVGPEFDALLRGPGHDASELAGSVGGDERVDRDEQFPRVLRVASGRTSSEAKPPSAMLRSGSWVPHQGFGEEHLLRETRKGAGWVTGRAPRSPDR